MAKKYLSEFEQEFEMDDEANDSSNLTSELSSNNELDNEYSYEVDDELETHDEFAIDDELETDDEFEIDDEFETDDEFESDDELESGEEYETDYASWSRDGNYDRDREFESRLYRAIRSNADNELQTELELGNILHEMEQDYFFGPANRWLKRKVKKYGKFAIPGYGALKAVSSLGRLKIRNLLKNKLLQTAAGFIPGAGPVVSKAMGIAGDIMNKYDTAKQKVEDIVQVGKDAYQNLASAIPDAQNEMEIRKASSIALKNAINKQNINKSKRVTDQRKIYPYKNRVKRIVSLQPNSRVAIFPRRISINRRQQVIPIKPNSIVVVKGDKLIILELK